MTNSPNSSVYPQKRGEAINPIRILILASQPANSSHQALSVRVHAVSRLKHQSKSTLRRVCFSRPQFLSGLFILSLRQLDNINYESSLIISKAATPWRFRASGNLYRNANTLLQK